VLLIPIYSIAQSGANSESLNEFSERKSREWVEEQKKIDEYIEKNNIPKDGYTLDGSYWKLVGVSKGLKYIIETNADAAATISTNEVYAGGSSGLNLSGQGEIIGLWEVGRPLTTHVEFNNTGSSRIDFVDNTNGDDEYRNHATHVAGTLIAGGVDSDARGMAFNASIRAYDTGNDESEMANEADNGLLISNHSYGVPCGWEYGNFSGNVGWHWFGVDNYSLEEDYEFGFYNEDAKDWDHIAYEASNYLIVKSAGNDRNDSPTIGSNDDYYIMHRNLLGTEIWVTKNAATDPPPPPDGGNNQLTNGFDTQSARSTAKNILTVGAVNDIPNGYTYPNDVLISAFSNWGPTDDGRIKPDIVANGVSLWSSTFSSFFPNMNDIYESMNGTSMSSPSVAGSISLLMEHQHNMYSNWELLSSTYKALVIHTADEAGDFLGPDYIYGWGLMNTEKAANLMTLNNEDDVPHIMESSLNNGQEWTYPVFVPLNIDELSVTICWTDPPGTPPQPAVDPPDLMLVNDLDLRIFKDSNGEEYFPWVLYPNNPSQAAANADNIRDNIEQVKEYNPDPGYYTIRVTHKGILEDPQLFSIIMSGNATFDIIAPTISLNNPSNQGPFSGNVLISADASDNESGINKVGFYIDNDLIDTKYNEPFETTWNTISYPNGSYTVLTRAFDNAQNESIDYISVNIENNINEPYIILENTNNIPNPVPYYGGIYQFNVTNAGSGLLHWQVDMGTVPAWVNSISPNNGIADPSDLVNISIAANNSSPRNCNIKFYNTEDPGNYVYVTINQAAQPPVSANWESFYKDPQNRGYQNVTLDTDIGEKWQIETTQSIVRYGGPVVIDDKIIMCGAGGVVCYDLEGNLVWQNSSISVTTYPAVYQNTLFAGDAGENEFYAINVANGSLIDTYQPYIYTLFQPSGKVAADASGIYVLSDGYNRLYALSFNGSSLSEKWIFNSTSNSQFSEALDFADSGPALLGDYVYINGIKPAGNGVFIVKIAKSSGVVTDFESTITSNTTYINTPVFYNSRIYITYNNSGHASIRSMNTSFYGEQSNFDFGIGANSIITPPVGNNSRVYVANKDGDIYFFNESDLSVAFENDFGGEIEEGIAISNNCLVAIEGGNTLLLINPISGAEIADFGINNDNYTAPVIKGNNIIFANQSEEIFCFSNVYPPDVNFHASPTTGEAPLTVIFNNTTDPGSSPITGYFWDFGDGSTSSATNPTHTYTEEGIYSVLLTATSSAGSDAMTRTDYIHVQQPPEITFIPSAHDFGEVDLGDCSNSYTFLLKNNGGSNAIGSVPDLTGNFQIVSGAGAFNIGAGLAIEIHIEFCPTTAGIDNVQLTALGDGSCNDASASLSGTGIELPFLDLSQANYSFGEIPMGDCSLEYTFTLTNSGGSNAAGIIELQDNPGDLMESINSESNKITQNPEESEQSKMIGGTDLASDFEITEGEGPFSLGPGVSKEIKVRFCPQSIGVLEALLSVVGTGLTNSVSSNLSGIGLQPDPPHISVAPESYSFGIICDYNSTSKLFTITNDGTSVAEFTIPLATSPPHFIVNSGSGTYSLNPGDTHDFIVDFNADDAASYSETLTITGIGNTNNIDIPLEGENVWSLSVGTNSYPNGSGDITGAGTYCPYNQCCLSATANPGYQFEYWEEVGLGLGIVSYDADYCFEVANVIGDYYYVAHFTESNAELIISPESYDFGIISIWDYVCHDFTLTNSGTISQDGIISAEPDMICSIAGQQEIPFSLAPGESLNFPVCLWPNDLFGVHNGNLNIVSNQGINITANIAGTAVLEATVITVSEPSEAGVTTPDILNTFTYEEFCINASANPGYIFDYWEELTFDMTGLGYIGPNLHYCFTVDPTYFGDYTFIGHFNPISFNVKVILEGPFNLSTGQMEPTSEDYFSFVQPFNIDPWNYSGDENILSLPNSNVVDWVLVEFRDTPGDASTATNETIIERQAALLLSDGSIVDVDGISPLKPPINISDNLYIVIWHRNHLGLMSASPLLHVDGTFTFDFSASSAMAYGGTSSQKEVVPGKWAMISGDANADGIIGHEDKINHWKNEVGNIGYLSPDFNLDGQVNNLDKNDFWWPNFNLSSSIPVGSFTCGQLLYDNRDGKSYKTVQLGNQCWMAENLNIGVEVAGINNQTDNQVIQKYCYQDVPANCDILGGLYQWNEMMQYSTTPGVTGVCPEGWHIPNDEEWKVLEGAVDTQYDYPNPIWNNSGGRGFDVGLHLKSQYGWANSGNGSDTYGFTAMPTGYRFFNGVFGYQYEESCYWTSNENDMSTSWFRSLNYNYDNASRSYANKQVGYSVRCLQDTEPQSWDCGDTLFDQRDGQKYETAQIGTQCWMAENLNYGPIIENTVTPSSGNGVEKYCYDNDPGNCDSYGALYNWNEMMNYSMADSAQGICPDGWHVPSDAEWCEIENYVDTTEVLCGPTGTGWRGQTAGNKLKSLYGWDQDGNGIDEFGFRILPSGYKHYSSNNFGYETIYGFMWTSTLGAEGESYYRGFSWDKDQVYRFDDLHEYGFSLRCIKD